MAKTKDRDGAGTEPGKLLAHPEVEALRRQIDELDGQIVGLINQRAARAAKIGAIKARNGVKAYNPSRENQVYQKVARENTGPLPDGAVKAIYREIMSATIALERPTRVAFFGQPGSFTHAAARTKFGASVDYLPIRDIRDVFLAVSRGHADYGLVPIENSTEGGINQSVDMFTETRLKICSELYLPIHQHLLCRGSLKNIRVIYSHPQPFAQCRNWLVAHFNSIKRCEVASTAEAAALAAKNPRAAAIAGTLAAELYNLPIRAEFIEDTPDNTTRFIVIAERMAERTGQDKTSLLIALKDQPGALLHLLQPFFKNGINLTRIESRPSKRKAWEYHFYIDLEGHVQEEAVQRTLHAIDGRVKHLEVLGSYPAAERTPPPARNRKERS